MLGHSWEVAGTKSYKNGHCFPNNPEQEASNEIHLFVSHIDEMFINFCTKLKEFANFIENIDDTDVNQLEAY
jgi:hypothetical protein